MSKLCALLITAGFDTLWPSNFWWYEWRTLCLASFSRSVVGQSHRRWWQHRGSRSTDPRCGYEKCGTDSSVSKSLILRNKQMNNLNAIQWMWHTLDWDQQRAADKPATTDTRPKALVFGDRQQFIRLRVASHIVVIHTQFGQVLRCDGK